MKKTNKKKIIVSTTLLIGGLFLTTANSTSVFACSSVKECNAQIETAKQERAKLQGEIGKTKDQSNSLQQEVSNLQQQVLRYSEQIDASTQAIELLAKQSSDLEKSMKETEETIKTRLFELQLAYETDKTLNFIADSNSITDMIERIQTVNDLSQRDREMIHRYDQQNKQVIENRNNAEKAREAIKSAKADQEKLIRDNMSKIEEFKKKQSELETKDSDVQKEQQLTEAELQKIRDELKNIPVTPIPTPAPVPTPNPNPNPNPNPKPNPTPTPNPNPKPNPTPTPNPNPNPKPNPNPNPKPSTNVVYPLTHAVLTSPYAESVFHDVPHNGTDYAPIGDPTLYSMVDGVVVANKYNSARGWLVAIAFNDGRSLKTLLYQHLSSQSPVSPGQRVSRGTIMGRAGNSGISFGVHLHVEVADAGYNGSWVNRGASAGPGLYATERYFGLPYRW